LARVAFASSISLESAAPREGAVFDSNRHTVRALLMRLGCEVIDLGVVRDDPVLLRQAFTEAAARADADRGGDAGVGGHAGQVLVLAGGELHRAQEAGGIARREQLFGIIALAIAAQFLGRA
jgi:hypothetical protein